MTGTVKGEREERRGGKGVDKGLAKCADNKNGAWCTGQGGGLCLPASLGLAVVCSERVWLGKDGVDRLRWTAVDPCYTDSGAWCGNIRKRIFLTIVLARVREVGKQSTRERL